MSDPDRDGPGEGASSGERDPVPEFHRLDPLGDDADADAIDREFARIIAGWDDEAPVARDGMGQRFGSDVVERRDTRGRRAPDSRTGSEGDNLDDLDTEGLASDDLGTDDLDSDALDADALDADDFDADDFDTDDFDTDDLATGDLDLRARDIDPEYWTTDPHRRPRADERYPEPRTGDPARRRRAAAGEGMEPRPPAHPQIWRGRIGGADADDDRYVPPDPPPLGGDLVSRISWAAVLGGPLFLVFAVLFWRELPRLLMLAALAAFVGGFVVLVARMPRDRDPDDDDGAVV